MRRTARILGSSLILAGCQSLLPSAPPVSADVEARLKMADTGCTALQVTKGKLSISGKGEVAGHAIKDLKVKSEAPTDEQVYGMVLRRQLCVLSYIREGVPDYQPWLTHVNAAFTDAWKPVRLEARDTELAALRAKQRAHHDRIAQESGTAGGKSLAPMDADDFRAAMPALDFLSVTEIEFALETAAKTKIKGVPVAANVGGKWAPDEFSNSIRPALASIRESIGQYAMRGITDVQLQQALVSAVYNAAAGRYAAGK